MNHGSKAPWENSLWWLIAVAFGLEFLAATLPRLLVPLVVLAAVAAMLRLLWWYTRL